MAKFREDEEQLLKEFNEAMSFIDANPIQGVTETPEGDVIIPVKALRFSQGEHDKDLHGDRFDPAVYLGHPAANSIIPAFFDHGKDKLYIATELAASGYTVKDALGLADELAMGKQEVGVAVRSQIDHENLYYNIIVGRRHRYRNMLKRLAEEGHIAPSTSAMFRENDPSDKSLVKMWEMKEVTLTPTQAEPRLEVVQKSLEEESQMGKEEEKGTPTPAAPATPPAPQPEGGGEEKPVNPLIDQIEKSFAPPAPEAVPPVDLGQMIQRFEAIEKSIADLTALVQTNLPQTLIAAQQIQEAMPILVEHVAKALAPGMAELVAAQKSKSQAERAIESGIRQPQQRQPATPARPGNSQWPAHTPGGK